MNKEYKIKEFDPTTVDEKVLFNLFKVLDGFLIEKRSDDPKPSNEFRLKSFRNPNPFFNEHWWLIWKGKNVVGFSILSVLTEISPSFEENKHVAFVHIRIDKNHRRMGIGMNLIKIILSKTKDYDFITTLQASTTFDSGFAFCDKLKGIIAMESAENRCKLSEVNWDSMDEWRRQGQIRAEKENRRLQWFEKCPEDIIEEFCNVYTVTMNQQPLGDLETRANITPETRRIKELENDKLNYIWHTVITREADGKISGLTDITYIPDYYYKIYQELTGVLEEYRGKGLGKWLKSEMLHFIKRQYPEVKYITTGNADANAAMLSINNRMGFKLYEKSRTYKFKIDELEKRIAEINKIN